MESGFTSGYFRLNALGLFCAVRLRGNFSSGGAECRGGCHKGYVCRAVLLYPSIFSGMGSLRGLQCRLAGLFKHCTASASPATAGECARFGGLVGPVSSTTSGSSAGLGDGEGAEKRPPSTAPSSQGASWQSRQWGLALGVFAHGGETYVLYGHSYASPQYQSTTVPVPERSYVMDRSSAPHSRDPESCQAQHCPLNLGN